MIRKQHYVEHSVSEWRAWRGRLRLVKRKSRKEQLSRAVVVVAWLVLFTVQLLDVLHQVSAWYVSVVKLLPMLMFIPGMMIDDLRSYLWLGIVSLLYFIGLFERIAVCPSDLLGIAGMVAMVVLFVATLLYVKWSTAARKSASEPRREVNE